MSRIDHIIVKSSPSDEGSVAYLHDNEAVSFAEAQTLTDAQKTRVRENIGALSENDISDLENDVSDLKSHIGYLRVGDRVFTQADLVQGSYNSSGAVTTNTARIRTKGFIRVNKGEKIVFKKGSNATEMLIGYFTTANVYESDSAWFGNITIEATSDKNLIFVFRKTSSSQTIAPSDYDADTKIVYPTTQYEESVGTKVEQTTIGIDNLMADLPDIPFTYTETSSSNQVTLFSSYNRGTYYADLKTGKYYLSIIKFDIKADDTSTVGTVRLVPTKKGTSGTEPMTTISRKDVSMASAPKGSSQYVYNLGTVSENLSVFYKLVSYSSGTTSRYYDDIITAVVCLEFDTQTEAENFIAQHISETTQDGWRTAIDLIARENIKTKNTILSQNPYTGKTCVVIGDSLSASYYDMWCSYFQEKTDITLTNQSVGGTSVAVRSGRTDSFVERVQGITSDYDLWIVFGGMNDKDSVTIGDMSSTDTSTFYGAYKAIINNIQSRSNHPIMIMIAPYHNVDAIVPYIEAVREIAKFYGIPLVDLAKISGVNPSTRSIYTRDWTHPNQLLCDRLRPQITRELCEKIVFPESTNPMPN